MLLFIAANLLAVCAALPGLAGRWRLLLVAIAPLPFAIAAAFLLGTHEMLADDQRALMRELTILSFYAVSLGCLGASAIFVGQARKVEQDRPLPAHKGRA